MVAAPAESREHLLTDLHSFASMGIPDLRSRVELPEQGEQEEVVEVQRRRQEEAIVQLRGQLEELENYAYMSGDSAPPSRLLLERQRVVMERLQESLNLDMKEVDMAALTEEQVDTIPFYTIPYHTIPLQLWPLVRFQLIWSFSRPSLSVQIFSSRFKL